MSIGVTNMSGNTKKFGECKVMSIDYTFSDWTDCKIELSKGLILKKETLSKDIIEKWGEPTEQYESGTLKYIKDLHVFYTFLFNDAGKILSVELENEVADETDKTDNAKRPKYLSDYSAPTKLSNDAFSYVFRLEGDLYKFPTPVSEFVKNGWEISKKVESVAAQQGVSGGIYIKKNGIEIHCGIRNYSDVQVAPEDTMVTKMVIDDTSDFELSGGIKLGMSESELLSKIDKKKFEYNSYNSGTVEYQLTEFIHHMYFEISKDKVLKMVNFGNEVLN